MADPQQTGGTLLTINYYDDYKFPGNAFGEAIGSQSKNVKSLLTGTKVNVLGSATMLLTVNYYDEEGRVVQSKAQNHLLGTDQVDNSYSFTDELLSSTRTHIANGQTTTIAMNYSYDHRGRKLESKESINGGAQVSLSKLTYNEVGQLKDKALGDNLQTLSYGYNERGWMRTMTTSGNLFALDLRYNTPDAAANAQWNGNIAQMNYLTKKVSTPGTKTFAYTYDKLNRLTNAVSTGNALDEAISYDGMGNIQQLIRGGTGQGTLNYTYSGNQLTTVTGYSARSYQYDPNGNATSDGMGKSITYNMLNLPAEVKQGNTQLATYTYNAAGQKLSNKSNTENTSGPTTWDYIGGIVYKGGQIAFIQTEEGRARPSNGTYLYEYNLSDHLGNTRVSIDKDPELTASNTPRIIQEDEYYSFGLRKPVGGYDYSNNNRYLYNGKEVQTDLANQYDYGARFYDPVIARWNAVDPLADSSRRWSPYTYGKNNPIRTIDPDGRFDVHINGSQADDAFQQLKASTSLTLTRDASTGKVTATGNAATPADAKLLEATRSQTVDVRINATTTNSVDGGAFQGSTVANGVTTTTQTVDPAQTKIIDNFYQIGTGTTVLHEVIESFIGGVDSPGTAAPTYNNTTPEYQNYKGAHDKAKATDPRYKEPNIIKEATGTKTSISKFPYNPAIPPALNPEAVLHN